MRVSDAIRQSPSGVALVVKKSGCIKSGRILLACNTSAGIRIIRSYTDPTVVRKLTDREKLLTSWGAVGWELSK